METTELNNFARNLHMICRPQVVLTQFSQRLHRYVRVRICGVLWKYDVLKAKEQYC